MSKTVLKINIKEGVLEYRKENTESNPSDGRFKALILKLINF